MITEKGKLLIGVEWPENSGQFHRDFEIRSERMIDTINVMEDEKTVNNKSLMGLSILARQIISLGDIQADDIANAVISQIDPTDFKELTEADRRLTVKLESFRSQNQADKKNDTGSSQTRDDT